MTQKAKIKKLKSKLAKLKLDLQCDEHTILKVLMVLNRAKVPISGKMVTPFTREFLSIEKRVQWLVDRVKKT